MEKPPPLTITDIDFLCLFFLGSGGGVGEWRGDFCDGCCCVGGGVVVGEGSATKCGVLSWINCCCCEMFGCRISGGDGESESDGEVSVRIELRVCVDELPKIGVLFALLDVANGVLALLYWLCW